MTPLSVKPLARDDVRQHVARIAGHRPDAAGRFITAAEDAFAALSSNPELGARKEMRNAALKGLRVWTIKGFRNYVIFYRFRETEVEILRVLHASRDWEAILSMAPSPE